MGGNWSNRTLIDREQAKIIFASSGKRMRRTVTQWRRLVTMVIVVGKVVRKFHHRVGLTFIVFFRNSKELLPGELFQAGYFKDKYYFVQFNLYLANASNIYCNYYLLADYWYLLKFIFLRAEGICYFRYFTYPFDILRASYAFLCPSHKRIKLCGLFIRISTSVTVYYEKF